MKILNSNEKWFEKYDEYMYKWYTHIIWMVRQMWWITNQYSKNGTWIHTEKKWFDDRTQKFLLLCMFCQCFCCEMFWFGQINKLILMEKLRINYSVCIFPRKNNFERCFSSTRYFSIRFQFCFLFATILEYKRLKRFHAIILFFFLLLLLLQKKRKIKWQTDMLIPN